MSNEALVAHESGFQEIVDRSHEAGLVAIDTEFVWETTYYPNLGLIQIGLGEDDVFLVDPQAVDIAPLGDIISAPSVELALHDATQDLQILARETGAFPQNVFDTQRAAGFVGYGASRSLQGLLSEALGIEVGKGETRSDWLQRPLTASQMRYAEDDVRYLLPLRERILERAGEMGHLDWLLEDRSGLDNQDLYREEPTDEALRRVRGRGISRLNGRQRAVLAALASWREEEARTSNRPRRHVLADNVLVNLAKESTRSSRPTANASMKRRHVDRYGEALEGAIAEGREADPIPRRRGGKPTKEDERHTALVRLLQAVLAGVCARSGIDEKLIANKSDLRELVNRSQEAHSPILNGWRAACVGDDIQRLLAGEARVWVEEGWPGLARE